MFDFWIAVILTLTVSLLTVLADWLASRLIFAAKTLRTLQQIVHSGLSTNDALRRVTEEIQNYRASQVGSLAWGADLATVAISMDFACLGLWIHDKSIFPFFARFNSVSVNYELPVWLILIGVHMVLLIVSLTMKHKHAEGRGAIEPDQVVVFPQRLWFKQNGWMVAGNSIGFTALLSTIVIMVKAI